MEGQLPYKEGFSLEKPLDPSDGVEYHKMRLSQTTGLVELARDYAFYTTALLFTHGGWQTDPVEDYLRQNPSCCPFRLDLPRPPFEGLDVGNDPVWNYRIFLVLKEQWEGLQKFLMSLGGIDHARRQYNRMLPQLLPVPDWLALEHKAILPTPVPSVGVVTFGIDGTDGCWVFEPVGGVPASYRVLRLSPDPDTIKLGKAVLAHHPRPFSSIQPSPDEALQHLASSRPRKGKPGLLP